MSRTTGVIGSVLLLLAVSVALSAQEESVESVLLPPRFYVGDRVELRLTLDVPAELVVSEPERLPQDPWLEVHRVEVQDHRNPGRSGKVRIRVFFTPFQPGQSRLPALSLGELHLGETTVHTRSVLEQEQSLSLQGLRGQLDLPLTAARLALIITIGIGVPAGAFFAFLHGARGLVRIREQRRRRLPYLRFRSILRRLKKQSSEIEGRSFFILLSLALKSYLAERLSVPLMSATTGEIRQQLSGLGLEPSLSESIHELLRRSDLVKFSGRKTGRREMGAELRRVEDILEGIEERIR